MSSLASTKERAVGALRRIVVEYGQNLALDPKRVENLLKDMCPDCRGDIHVLASAARERIPQELLNPTSQIPVPLLCKQLAIRLKDAYHLSPDAARWGVEAWSVALGLPEASVTPLEPANEEAHAPPAPPAPPQRQQVTQKTPPASTIFTPTTAQPAVAPAVITPTAAPAIVALPAPPTGMQSTPLWQMVLLILIVALLVAGGAGSAIFKKQIAGWLDPATRLTAARASADGVRSQWLATKGSSQPPFVLNVERKHSEALTAADRQMHAGTPPLPAVYEEITVGFELLLARQQADADRQSWLQVRSKLSSNFIPDSARTADEKWAAAEAALTGSEPPPASSYERAAASYRQAHTEAKALLPQLARVQSQLALAQAAQQHHAAAKGDLPEAFTSLPGKQAAKLMEEGIQLEATQQFAAAADKYEAAEQKFKVAEAVDQKLNEQYAATTAAMLVLEQKRNEWTTLNNQLPEAQRTAAVVANTTYEQAVAAAKKRDSLANAKTQAERAAQQFEQELVVLRSRSGALPGFNPELAKARTVAADAVRDVERVHGLMTPEFAAIFRGNKEIFAEYEQIRIHSEHADADAASVPTLALVNYQLTAQKARLVEQWIETGGEAWRIAAAVKTAIGNRTDIQMFKYPRQLQESALQKLNAGADASPAFRDATSAKQALNDCDATYALRKQATTASQQASNFRLYFVRKNAIYVGALKKLNAADDKMLSGSFDDANNLYREVVPLFNAAKGEIAEAQAVADRTAAEREAEKTPEKKEDFLPPAPKPAMPPAPAPRPSTPSDSEDIRPKTTPSTKPTPKTTPGVVPANPSSANPDLRPKTTPKTSPTRPKTSPAPKLAPPPPPPAP